MKTRIINITRILLGLIVACLLPANASGGSRFNQVRPSTTGVPGEEVRAMNFDSAGNLWMSQGVVQILIGTR